MVDDSKAWLDSCSCSTKDYTSCFYFTEAEDHVSVLQKSRMPDKEKSKWMTVLHPGFISSDHSASGTDSEDDTLVTQPLEWRSTKGDRIFIPA